MNAFKKHFDPFVCHGDTIQCEFAGITFTARLEHDPDSHVNDSECYTKAQVTAWKKDEWHYFGVVISAEQDGVSLGDHLRSLWGIEGNFPSRKKHPNKYFRDVANELLPEAMNGAFKERSRIINILTEGQAQ